MALNETGQDIIIFPDGTRFSRTDIVNSSIEFYKTEYEDNLTDICDFSDGSEIRTLHESIAVELFAKYRYDEQRSKEKYVKYATGTYLDELACEYHINRKRGRIATGTVTFSTTANVDGEMRVPRGTVILARDTGYEYILQEDVIITSANTPENGTVYSKLIGEEYNAEADTLTAFKNIETIRTEIKVTNPVALTGGENMETDDELRERILQAKQERAYGTAPVYQSNVVNKVNGIHDIQFVDPNLLTTYYTYPRHYKVGTTSSQTAGKTFEQIKSYLCTDCTAVVFVNSYLKPCPDQVLADVEYELTLQKNLVVGQKFHFERAYLDKIYFNIELYVTSTVQEETLEEHLDAFFNMGDVETKSGPVHYHGVDLGQSVTKSQLLDVLESIPGVHQVGYIKLSKYYPEIPKEISQWNNNGKSGYNYIDNDGYYYWRANSEISSIGYWGVKNFTELETTAGKVLVLGRRSEIDSSTKTTFGLRQILVNEKGEVID